MNKWLLTSKNITIYHIGVIRDIIINEKQRIMRFSLGKKKVFTNETKNNILPAIQLDKAY